MHENMISPSCKLPMFDLTGNSPTQKRYKAYHLIRGNRLALAMGKFKIGDEISDYFNYDHTDMYQRVRIVKLCNDWTKTEVVLVGGFIDRDEFFDQLRIRAESKRLEKPL